MVEVLPHILIVESRFYTDIADELTKGAYEYLETQDTVAEKIEVPGAFEIPAAIGYAIKSGRYDGYIALGCVIRGETSHYDYVCAESARGLGNLAVNENAAIGYGIITVNNKKQAMERARTDKGNKGGLAAQACMDMISLKHGFGL